MVTRQKEQLGGVFLALGGLLLSFVFYYQVMDSFRKFGEVTFFVPTSIGPTFIVTGIALILLPSYRRERLERGEKISHLKGVELLTTRWKIVLGAAILCNFAYYYFVLGFFHA